jgi:hypothetical protein
VRIGVAVIAASAASIAFAVLASFAIQPFISLWPEMAWFLVPAMLAGSALLWVAVLNLIGKP